MMDGNMFLDAVWTLESSEMEVLALLACTAVASHSTTYFQRSNPLLCLSISDEHFLLPFSLEFFLCWWQRQSVELKLPRIGIW